MTFREVIKAAVQSAPFDEEAAAASIVDALERAGFYICRMDGGVHTGVCPSCGCQPQHGAE